LPSKPRAPSSRVARRHPTAGGGVRRSLEEYGRGIAGGLIFSVPLLFTMEVWWAGFSASPSRLVVGVVATFIILLGFNEHAGLRPDHTALEVVIDSIEELGLGLVVATGALALIGRIDLTMSVSEIVGKVVVEGLLVAIGVSVGTAQFGGQDAHDDQSQAAEGSGVVAVMVMGFCGAVLLAANVAPTEEVVVLGTEMSPILLMLTMMASAALAALVLFFTEFRGSGHLTGARAPRAVIEGCVITYAVALAASAVILWFFGRFDDVSVRVMVGETVVLGFAATLGASAGRLLLGEDT
jgi:putative integral membrane protein (TIGR02587 family)